MAGTMKMFCIRKNIFFCWKKIYCSYIVPCNSNRAAAQNLYTVNWKMLYSDQREISSFFLNFLYPPHDLTIDKRACIFNVSNGNFDYVTELSYSLVSPYAERQHFN